MRKRHRLLRSPRVGPALKRSFGAVFGDLFRLPGCDVQRRPQRAWLNALDAYPIDAVDAHPLSDEIRDVPRREGESARRPRVRSSY
jgi:hypothetical protein